jgi:putative oxidoreductase
MTSIFKNKSNDVGLLFVRIAIGVLLPFHGIAKLIQGIDWIGGLLAGISLPSFIKYGVFIGEIIAPVLLLIGFRTRIAAMFVCFNMFMAVLLAHRHEIFTIKPSGAYTIELDLLYFLGALALVFMGGGKFSVLTKSKWD